MNLPNAKTVKEIHQAAAEDKGLFIPDGRTMQDSVCTPMCT